jgi:hypothetical protein
MSSAPRSPEAPNQKGSQQRKGKPGPEKKAAPGPVITPQVLGIVFGLILIAGVIYYVTQVNKITEKESSIQSQISTQEGLIKTYKTKGAKLEEAINLNNALREKLDMLDYLFLQDQSSILPFYENTLLPLIDSGTLRMGKIEPLEPYNFEINMAMEPFNTIPSIGGIEKPESQFTISYTPEQGGTPVEEPITTTPKDFLTPYSIKLKEFVGTYSDCKKFIEKLQTDRNAKMITVHCLKNDDSKSSGLYRITTSWDLVITVYFMNPEVNASGDQPPGLPGSQKC